MSGSISKISTTSGSSWGFVLELGYDGTGRRRQLRRRGFATRKSAQAALEQALADQARGQLTVPGRRTVEDYLTGWLETVQMTLTAGGYTNYRTLVRTYVLPRPGGLQVSAVSAMTLSTLYAELLRRGGRGGRPLSATTVRLVHKVLHKAFKDAVLWGVLGSNPAERASVPRRVRPRTQVWSPAEAARFLQAAADDRLHACWVLAVTAGLRRGELAGLRWSDVDLERGIVAVTQQRTTDSDCKVVVTEPKAGSRRSVDLGDRAAQALRQQRSAQAAERLAWGPGWADTGLVFVHADGTAVHPQHLTDLFHRAAAAAGLPRIRLHDLRHTAATLALMAGVHPKVVQERLGHSSIAMTLDVYSHVMSGLGHEAAARVDALLEAQAAEAATPPINA